MHEKRMLVTKLMHDPPIMTMSIIIDKTELSKKKEKKIGYETTNADCIRQKNNRHEYFPVSIGFGFQENRRRKKISSFVLTKQRSSIASRGKTLTPIIVKVSIFSTILFRDMPTFLLSSEKCVTMMGGNIFIYIHVTSSQNRRQEVAKFT